MIDPLTERRPSWEAELIDRVVSSRDPETDWVEATKTEPEQTDTVKEEIAGPLIDMPDPKKPKERTDKLLLKVPKSVTERGPLAVRLPETDRLEPKEEAPATDMSEPLIKGLETDTAPERVVSPWTEQIPETVIDLVTEQADPKTESDWIEIRPEISRPLTEKAASVTRSCAVDKGPDTIPEP